MCSNTLILKQMKKIFQINSSCNRGSTGRIAEQIGRAAQERGYECYIAYGRYYQPSGLKAIKMGNKFTNAIHGISSRLFDNHGLMSTGPTKELVRQMKEIKPDIVHLHNIHGYFLNYKVLFEYLASAHIPVVWTLHDCWPFTGHCAYFDFAGCNLWETGCHAPCPCKKGYPESIMIDASKKNYELKKQLFTSVENLTLVPVSEWLGGLVSKSYLGKYPVKVIHNGIDVDKFKPQEDTDELKKRLGIAEKYVLLGVASAWDGRKGLKDYIKLAERLPEDTIIILVGLTKEQISILPDNIIGIECTEDQRELALYYSTADIVLNLSYEETFGMTTVEGLGCGTPSIVYNKTASPELAAEEICTVVEAGDTVKIMDAIKAIRTSNPIDISRKCRERALEKYDKVKAYEAYMQLYSALTGGGKLSEVHIVLGVAAIWEPRKGFDDFLKLRKELPDYYIIVLVGVNAEQKKMLPEGMIGVEHTESLDELVKLYSSADVFVNTTYEDNFPTTNLEALACGTPVITYRTGGSVEAVFEGTGSVVEQGDILGLKKEVERLCSKDRTIMKSECRQRALENFKAEERFEDYVNLYDSLLN